MAKWGEIKCPGWYEQDALWEDMVRALEESDAREARLEAKLAKAVEALQAAADDLSGYVGYSYADEYRTTLAELNYDERSEEKGQDDD